MTRLPLIALLLTVPVLAQQPSLARQPPGWPGVFDPYQVLDLHLEMAPADWKTIQNDDSLSIEVPAQFWSGNEAPILVAVRRKSADPLDSGAGFRKVGLKIDVNELVSGQEWWGLKKLSLENGDDQDVVVEGMAWFMQTAAAPVYGYQPGYAAWVTLDINGVYTGVYVNAEQRDKTFLKNRGLYTPGATWLYKVGDPLKHQLKVGSGDSPTVQALCYYPFLPQNQATCGTPDPATLAAELPGLVDMQGMLTLAAVDAFVGNPDAIFSHGKNFYFLDDLFGVPRRHYPWDQDSVFTDVHFPIYYDASDDFPSVLFGVPEFLAHYDLVMDELLAGPFQAAPLHAFLDAMEPRLVPLLAADPNNQIGPLGDVQAIHARFDSARKWISDRIVDVNSQLP